MHCQKINIDETHQRVDVKEILIHKEYDRVKKKNDIAILKLDKGLIFNDNVKPACLPDSSISYDAFGIASGWGDIDNNKSKFFAPLVYTLKSDFEGAT